ncbi:hypothetical protein, conserved [Plakobranchus ocellatus]|uniref:Uncharacterized protein n=1 Tax=Plakobranchus ocellatus TaxID=259542 RepID=A0AAV3ZB22_9GAST|nr:hypothetical protein, conserved [Plakobranchus ocellatus]
MKVSTLTQALHPENFDIIIQSVRELAEFDEEQHHFKRRSLALRLGRSLKKCAFVLKAEAIKKEDDDLVMQADRFDSLFSGDWFDYVGANEGQSIHKERFNKPKLLPACADIEKIHLLLDTEMRSNYYSPYTKVTLCSVSLFNRKRGGEAHRLKIDDFEKGMVSGTNSQETYDDLSELEKKLVSHFSRMEIRGNFW